MRSSRLTTWWAVCAVAWSLAACSGASPTSPTRETAGGADGTGRAAAARVGDEAAGGVEKVTICHIPPGNPENAHTIVVGAPAVPAHIEEHGDSVGECGGGGGGGG
jgi:hypothetical protein